jgi:hypothetical protein
MDAGKTSTVFDIRFVVFFGLYEKTLVSNANNINKATNHLSLQTTEQKIKHTKSPQKNNI